MNFPPIRFSLRIRSRAVVLGAALTAVALGGLTACGTDPYAIQWAVAADTADLYSLARPEIGLPSGFNFYNRSRVVVETASATGTWDVALGTEGGSLVLLPPGALGINGAARVATVTGTTFDDLAEAPADTTRYSATDPVPVKLGEVYVVRTNQSVGMYGEYCVYYAKMAPVDIDVAAGRLRFVYDSSPVCNDRNLIPKN